MRVGLIGVGLMGHGIGKNIVTKGHSLAVVAHRNRAPVESLLALGATECKTPAELAKNVDLIILCVTGSPEVENAVYGANGIAAAASPGLIIADCTTAEPESTIRIATDLAAKGIFLVDTPMIRTPKEAEAGKLSLMVAGPVDVLAKIRPVLDCFADTIVNAGPVGAAHQLKLLNNFVAISNAAIAAEAITVASKAGINMEALRDVVISGGARSVMFERLINVPLSDDDTSAKFAIKNARKDLRYYTNMTEQLPVASFMAEQAHQLLVMADNMGYGDRYLPRLIDVLQKVNGIERK